MAYHFELSKTKIHRLDRASLANIHSHRLSFATKTLIAEKQAAELKLIERRETKSPYIGANLQSSRTPSAIDTHCRSSYETARRKLHSSRAKVRFYVAGENNHNAIYAVSPQRFASFDTLLGSLTKTPICREKGKETHIFSLDGSHKITALNELHSGESYVCATYEVFEQLSQERERPVTSANRYRTLQTAALAAARPTHTSQSTRSRHSATHESDLHREIQSEESEFIAEIKPRLITVLRGGMKPRKSVRILLSRKNTRSFEHTIAGIGEILCPGEQVKRLFGMSGRLVMCLADFYLEDSVFFAYSNDKMNPEDLALDKTEVKCVGAYRFRKASAYGRVTLTSHQKGVTNERARSLTASALPTASRLSNVPRTGSRVKSSQSSVAALSCDYKDVEAEKHTQEAMEKTSDKAEETQPVNGETSNLTGQSGQGSQTSIKTVSQKSDGSKESIHLAPSRPPSTRPQSESKVNQSTNANYPSSPVHSPSKKRHPSRSSQSPAKENSSTQASRPSVKDHSDTHKSIDEQQPVSVNSKTPTEPMAQSQMLLKENKKDDAATVEFNKDTQVPTDDAATGEVNKDTQAPTDDTATGEVNKDTEALTEDRSRAQASEKIAEPISTKNSSTSSLKEQSGSHVQPLHAEENKSVNSVISERSGKENQKENKESKPAEENRKTSPVPVETAEGTPNSKASASPTLSKVTSKSSASSSVRSSHTSSSARSSHTSITESSSGHDEDKSSIWSEDEDDNVNRSPQNEGAKENNSDKSRSASRTSKLSVQKASNKTQDAPTEELVQKKDVIVEPSAKEPEAKEPSAEEPEADKEESEVDEDLYSVDFDETAVDTDDSQEASRGEKNKSDK